MLFFFSNSANGIYCFPHRKVVCFFYYTYIFITREQQNILVYEVEKHDLMVSAGSDFHTPENKWITLVTTRQYQISLNMY